VFTKYGDQARAVLDALLDKYADRASTPSNRSTVLKVDPLRPTFGTPIEIVKSFGGKDQYLAAMRELEAALYKNAA
jgi:type I restriction enzyme, R subunit